MRKNYPPGKLSSFFYLCWSLYKLLLIVNLFFSGMALNWFAVGGFSKAPVYSVAIFIKLAGYGSCLMLNQLLFSQYRYFYLNLGFSSKKLFTWLFLADMLGFIFFICCLWLITNFI